MTDFNEFHQFAQTKVGEDVNVRFVQPLPQPAEVEGGQPTLTLGDRGVLLAAYNDGVLLRTERSERFYAWDKLAFIEFPSNVLAP